MGKYRFRFWFKRPNGKHWEEPMVFFNDDLESAYWSAMRFAEKFGFADFVYDDDLEVGELILPARDISGRVIGRAF